MAIDENLAYIRLLIADVDEANPLISTEQLNTLLTTNQGNPLLAAADALDAIATSEVLVSKKIRTQDLSTDGPAVAAELRKQAERLRARADIADEAWAGFDVVDTVVSRRRPELTEHPIDAWGL